MNDETQLSEMLIRYVAGDCTAEEVRELSSRIERDAEAQDLLAEILSQGVALKEFAQAHSESMRATYPMPQRWTGLLTWRPFAAAVAGIVFGAFCTSLVFAYALPKSLGLTTVLLPLKDSSFESGLQVPAQGIPEHPGVWSGDFSRVVVAENGIAPIDGRRMLRILRSDHEQSPNDAPSFVGEVTQMIDLRPLRDELSVAERLVEISAQFNAIPTEMIHEFNVKAAAFRGDFAEAPRLWEDHEASICRSTHTVLADSELGTWQRVSVPLVLPPEADFLIIQCAAVFKGSLTEGATEFSGHYVDQVDVRLIGSGNDWTRSHDAN